MTESNCATTILLTGALAFLLIGCRTLPSDAPQTNSGQPSGAASVATEEPRLSTPQSTLNSSPSENASGTDSVLVTIYKPDSDCAQLVEEKVSVPADRPMEAAVEKVLDAQDSVEFDLSGYRVSVDSSGTATVDLRLAPNSRRSIVSLSACEQFALFTSLQETLTQNPDWNIKTVKFKERGEDISL